MRLINGNENLGTCRSNVLIGLALFLGVLLLSAFVAALMGSKTGEVAGALGAVVASVIGGSFVLTAALVAWKSVQAQIGAQALLDKAKREDGLRAFKTALTAELLVFSTAIIRATSVWNRRAHETPTAIPTDWPKLIQPRVYNALIAQIGLLEEGWPASAMITFYGNVLELNELADDFVRGRPTTGENVESMAQRFRMMAINLAEALDGLNADRRFPIMEFDLATLFMPTGITVENVVPRPTSLQEQLLVLGGRSFLES